MARKKKKRSKWKENENVSNTIFGDPKTRAETSGIRQRRNSPTTRETTHGEEEEEGGGERRERGRGGGGRRWRAEKGVMGEN